MLRYRPAGEDFRFPYLIPELEPFEVSDEAVEESASFVYYSFPENEYPELICRTVGWVGSAQRMVEVYESPNGILLKVEGGNEFFIAPHGELISKRNAQQELSQLDREIILGPGLVLVLALRGVWTLHASAAMYQDKVIVFLGESGLGKSTLAAYLSHCSNWRLVADDILPVKIDPRGVIVLPRYPQLKLPMDAQPAVHLPEHLPLKTICVLTQADPSQMPELHKLSTAQTVQSLLSHIAGTRMFNASLLTQHLEFSTQAAKQVPAYRLIYPHRRDTLPLVRDLLEKIC